MGTLGVAFRLFAALRTRWVVLNGSRAVVLTQLYGIRSVSEVPRFQT